MSGPVGSQQWMYSSGFYPHEIGNSARLDTNSYFTRTPSSASNRKTYTVSLWFKRSGFPGAAASALWGSGVSGARDLVYFYDEELYVNGWNGSSYIWNYQTSQVFRDPSAWYHLVVAVDTTNSTAGDRVKIYINGNRVTAFDTSVDPGLNLDTYTNNTVAHSHGSTPYNTAHFNGYITEINFIDGQALDASYFGETKADTWIPKKYTGSYGTNGYYLDFATRATDPIDASGNGNNFSSVNVVATDWMLDSPTNNFATFNPITENDGSNRTFSQGNLRMQNDASNYAVAHSTILLPKTGKWIFEVLFQRTPTGASPWTYNSVGLTTDPHFSSYISDGTSTYAIDDHGGSGSQVFIQAGTEQGSHAGFPAGTIVQVFVDRDNNELTFSINGTLQTQTGATITIPADVDLYAINGTYHNITYGNFGQDSSFAGEKTAQGNTDANGLGDFYYAPPAGFLALCTANLPDTAAAFNPAVNNSPQDHFNTALYTGNGSTNNITGVGFQPDFVWIKSRSEAYWHRAFDVLRGATKQLYPNDSAAEATESTSLTAFGSDGFTLGSFQYTNNNTTTFVSWNWKAGGTGVSNTDGTITSTVSANTDAGFSVFTWTGTGSSATIGHGLGQTPKVVFWKRRDSAENWSVQSTLLSAQTELELNGTAAESSTDTRLGSTADWTSSVVSVISYVANNASSGTYVAYCFAEKEGFSKFGSYTGNGSTDGPFVYTGFKPAFVIIKNASSAGGWRIWDNKRNVFNLTDNTLHANDATAENTYGNDAIDMTSNGLKIRTVGSYHNTSGDTYIYMAFAEMPFKYANAR